MDLSTRIGIRVRELRKTRKLSQEALAELIGRSVDAVSLLERGRINPGVDTLEAIGKGLGIALRDLLDFEDRPTKDREMVALQTVAMETIRRLNKTALSVAVKQLDALVNLKNR